MFTALNNLVPWVNYHLSIHFYLLNVFQYMWQAAWEDTDLHAEIH